jgi:hypothetical protein
MRAGTTDNGAARPSAARQLPALASAAAAVAGAAAIVLAAPAVTSAAPPSQPGIAVVIIGA